MEIQTQQFSDWQRFMRSYTASVIFIAIIILVLLIPLVRISFLIQERKERSMSVVSDIQYEWGSSVQYSGLVLVVPAVKKVEETVLENAVPKKVVRETVVNCYFYPQSSSDKVASEVTEKKRGIFGTPVYTANIASRASFDIVAITRSNPAAGLVWKNAKMAVVAGDGTRYRSIEPITVNGNRESVVSEWKDSGGLALFGTGELGIDPAATATLEALANVTVSGSETLYLEPLSGSSEIALSTNWSDPAFSGRNLPVSSGARKNDKGYDASWKTRSTPGNKATAHVGAVSGNKESGAAIRFIQPVDHYQLNERTVKYGVLVFVLTFAVFFLIQLVGKIAMHPLHYLMVGLALTLFYCLLLAFSEQTGFIAAYLIASVTIIALVSWYTWTILRNTRFSLMAMISMTLLYAFILVIVNLEIYALIVGSLGLLFVLAAIMSVTRRLSLSA
jgi:inner membrane protein